MGRRSLALLGAAMALALNACGEQPEHGISEPAFAPPIPPSPTSCNFDLIKSGINAYFAQPLQGTVQVLKDQMQVEWNTSGHESQTRNLGFDIMREISLAANSGTAQGTPADGSALTNADLRCMFFDLLDLNKFPTFPLDFTDALTPSSGGAYYVRGGSSDSTPNVVASDAQGIISAIAPSPSWTGSMSGARALIFGEPIPASFAGYKGYDWVVLPTDVTFNPQAAVGLCFNDARDFAEEGVPISTSTTSMVLESSVGVLAYDGALATTICSSTKSLALLGGEARPHGPFERLARFTFGLLRPQSLYASAMVATTTTIGKVSGVKSTFLKLEVPSVASKWQKLPPSRPKVNVNFTVEIEAIATDDNGKLVPALGVCYKLTGTTNSGTPQQAQLLGDHNCGSGSDPSSLTTLVSGKAIATITAKATQKGGLIITASGNVVDRAGTVQTLTSKANVIP